MRIKIKTNLWACRIIPIISFWQFNSLIQYKMKHCFMRKPKEMCVFNLFRKWPVHGFWNNHVFVFWISGMLIIYTLNGLIGCFMRFYITTVILVCLIFSTSSLVYIFFLLFVCVPLPPLNCTMTCVYAVEQLRVDLNSIENREIIFLIWILCTCECIAHSTKAQTF